MHTQSSVKKWSSQYPIFKEASTNVWPRIVQLLFTTVRHTKIQTFEYRLIYIYNTCRLVKLLNALQSMWAMLVWSKRIISNDGLIKPTFGKFVNGFEYSFKN